MHYIPLCRIFALLIHFRSINSHVATYTTIDSPISPALTTETTQTVTQSSDIKVTVKDFNPTDNAQAPTLTPPPSLAPPTASSPTPLSTGDNQELNFTSPFFCPCDYYFSTCEFNCCCDPDCSPRNKSLFTDCTDRYSLRKIFGSLDSDKCYRRDFVFRNNTPFLVHKSHGGLFCIANTNVKTAEVFPVVNVNISRISKTKADYFWDFATMEQSQIEFKNSHYKYGDKIQLIRADFNNSDPSQYSSRRHLSLPAPALGNPECATEIAIGFLEATETICTIPIKNLSLDCETEELLSAKKFLANWVIIGNPAKNLSDSNLIEWTLLRCRVKGSKCLNDTTLRSPTFDRTTSACLNVLAELEIVLSHRGLKGIVHATAHMYYINLTNGESSIRQRYSAMSQWENPVEDPVHPHVDRTSSGNPGYLFGKPIRIGTATQIDIRKYPNETKLDPTDVSILNQLKHRDLIIHPYSVRPLTLLSPHDCIGNRKPLLFGYDFHVNCYLDLQEVSTCQNLQALIGQLLVDIPPRDFRKRYLSALGNPDLTSAGHWVPLMTSSDPVSVLTGGTLDESQPWISGCSGVVTSLEIQILYGHVGSIHFPQLRIFGVLFQFGKPINIPAQKNSSRKLLLSSSAKFMDITSAPYTPIPKWPIISIQLPADFFYPFSGAISIQSNMFIILIISCSVISYFKCII